MGNRCTPEFSEDQEHLSQVGPNNAGKVDACGGASGAAMEDADDVEPMEWRHTGIPDDTADDSERAWRPQDMAETLELHKEFQFHGDGPAHAALAPLFAVYQAGGEHHASDRESLSVAARSCRKLAKARERSETERTDVVGLCEKATVDLGRVEQELATMQREEHRRSVILSADRDADSTLQRRVVACERLAHDMAVEAEKLESDRDQLQSKVDGLVATGLQAAATKSAIEQQDFEANVQWSKAQLEMEDREKNRHLQNYRLRSAQRALNEHKQTYVNVAGHCQEKVAEAVELKRKLREESRLQEQLRERIDALHRLATMPRKQATLQEAMQ